MKLLSLLALTALALGEPDAQSLQADLGAQLSRDGIISTTPPPRWSNFHAPKPAVVVNVETEQDVAKTVKYCTEHDIPFVAQNGGNGWATTFDLGANGVLINMAKLNQVTFNSDKTRATIGGGSIINNTIAHAFDAGALITTGNCNCVGALGAMLGGGYGNLMGLNGFGVDNIESMRVVTADGKLRDVTAKSDPDLFWAMRGAAANFGIVTSAVVKSQPASKDDMMAWTGGLVFSSDQLEKVVQAIEDIELKANMNVFMYFISLGEAPVILVTPYMYKGTVEEGHKAFKKLYDIGPKQDTTSVLPYNEWNTGGDVFCTKGGRKPSYGVGFEHMVPETWRSIWEEYVKFQRQPTAESSVVLVEAYSDAKATVDHVDAAFPYRKIRFNGVAIPWYTESSLDCQAQALGKFTRKSWRATSSLPQDATYVNFAHGDEPLDTIYGPSLDRLKSIKAKVDPDNHFNQWFNIK